MKNLKTIGLSLILAAFGATNAWAQRSITAVVAGNQMTGAGAVSLVLASQGNEQGVGFSVTFDPVKLRYDGHANGADLGSAALNVNSAQATSGRVGVGLAMSSGTFAVGNRQLVVLNFTVLEPATSSVIGFGDVPIVREIVDAAVNVLTATYNTATITLNLPPSIPTVSIPTPPTQAITSGQNATFSVVVGGNPTPTVKWQKSTTPPTIWADLTNGGRIAGATSSTLAITGALVADAGSYRAVANNTQGTTEGPAATLTVNKADQTITFPALQARIYSPNDTFTLSATGGGSGQPVTFSSSDTAIVTISGGNTANILRAGNVAITANQAGNDDYNPAPAVSQPLVINRATAGFTVSGLAQVYDGTPRPVTVVTTPVGLPVIVTYNGNAAVPVSAGSYAVAASINETATPNYTGSAPPATLVIAKAQQTITFPTIADKTYLDPDFTVTATAAPSGITVTFTSLTPTVATVTSGGTVSLVAGGTAIIRASAAGDANFEPAPPVDRSFTVIKAAATVAFDTPTLSQVFTGAPRVVTATTSPPSLPLVIKYDGSTTPPVNAGTYPVSAEINDPRYQGIATGALVVDKANQVITFVPLESRALDFGSFPLTATADSGLPVSYATSNPSSGVVATISVNIVTLVNTGTITITASQSGGPNHYPATPVPQLLRVTNQSQTITFDQAQLPAKIFGDQPFPIQAASNRGLLVGFESSNPGIATVSASTLAAGVSTATVTIVGAGSATITATQAGDDNTGAATPVQRNLAVARRVAPIVVGDLAQTYNGTPRPVSIATDPTGLPVTVTYSGSAMVPVNAGNYPILAVINEALSENYTGSAAPATLVVAMASQTITFGALPIKLISDAPFTLTATADSLLAVEYTSSNSAVATVSGNTVTLRGLGTTSITARQPGNNNFNAATPVVQPLVVNPIAPIITSPLTARGVVGRSFFYAIQTNPTIAAFESSALPAGLTLNATTGVISGNPTTSGTSNVSITARNVTSADTRTLAITIQDPPPVITSPAAASGQVGVAFTYTATATPATGVTFAATGLPPPLTMTAAGVASGTPTQAGTFTATITATNTTGSSSQPVVIDIIPAPSAPVYTGPVNLSGTVGVQFSFTPNFGGATGLTFAQTGTLPPPLTFTAATGLISGTPTQVGVFPITITATRSGVSTSVDLTISINPGLSAPVVTNAVPRFGTVGFAFTYTLTANPAAGVTFAATGLPGGLTLAPATGVISGTPTTVGTSPVNVSATNAAGTGPVSVLVITIVPSAVAPVITSAPVVTGRVGVAFASSAPYTYQLTASNNPTAFEITSGTLPDGLVLDPATGAITGTPTTVGHSTVWFAARAGTDRGYSLGVLFVIAPASNTPVITSNGTAQGQVGQPFTYGILATNSPTSYAATGLPTGLTLDPASGVISGIPNAATTPTVSVTLTASNAGGASNPKILVLTIVPAPATPVITSPLTATGRVGTAFSYQVSASESPTSYVAAGLPAGLMINPGTGAISGTPTVAGSFAVTLRAANAGGLGAPSTLALDFAAALEAPAITSAATVQGRVGTALTYQITATNGPIVGYSITGTLPLGVALNTATGAITGTPNESGLFSVRLSASNAGGTSLPQSLLLAIAPALGVPAITSANRVVETVGNAFSYTITATNMTGTTPYPPPQTLDAVNLPPGLAVNPATGVIQGVPTTAGTYTASLVGTNATGSGPPRDLTIIIEPPLTAPVVTSPGHVSARVGVAFSYQVTASNNPTSFEVVGAPAWMSVNNTTGLVAGSPAAPGQLVVLLVASNAAGISSPRMLVINIAAAAGTPLLTSSRTASGTVNAPFTYGVTCSPAATNYVATGLPAGLTLDPSSGAISGIPVASGVFPVTIRPSNASGLGVPAVVVLNIQPSLQIVAPGS